MCDILIVGDDYSLIWDPRLIHKFDAPPMNYDAPDPPRVSKVTDQHLKDNFIDYLKVRTSYTSNRFYQLIPLAPIHRTM
jgi:hypothetical protein